MSVLNYYITIWMLCVCHNVGIISINLLTCYLNGYAFQPAVSIIQDCIQRREIDEYQYNKSIWDGVPPPPPQDLTIQITNALIDMQNFAYIHLLAVQRSQNIIGFDSKSTSHTYIANALDNFEVTACRMVTDDRNTDILNQIHDLMLSTKIGIVIDAIRAKASFTTPVMPLFEMRRDITDFTKPPCDQTVMIGVLGRWRFEVRITELSQAYKLIDQHVLDDFSGQEEFMVTRVMKEVIGKAPNLSVGEGIVRSEQVKNTSKTFDFQLRIERFIRDYGVSINNMCNVICNPGGNCASGLVFLNNLRFAYPSIAWGKFGQELFGYYEDVSLFLYIYLGFAYKPSLQVIGFPSFQ